MSGELERRINSQEDWTFRECIGLASDHGVRTRVVVAMVLAAGKNYIDSENPEPRT